MAPASPCGRLFLVPRLRLPAMFTALRADDPHHRRARRQISGREPVTLHPGIRLGPARVPHKASAWPRRLHIVRRVRGPGRCRCFRARELSSGSKLARVGTSPVRCCRATNFLWWRWQGAAEPVPVRICRSSEPSQTVRIESMRTVVAPRIARVVGARAVASVKGWAWRHGVVHLSSLQRSWEFCS